MRPSVLLGSLPSPAWKWRNGEWGGLPPGSGVIPVLPSPPICSSPLWSPAGFRGLSLPSGSVLSSPKLCSLNFFPL